MDLFDKYESKAEDLILKYSEPNEENYREIFTNRGIRANSFEEFIDLFFSELSYCLTEGIDYAPWVEEVTEGVSREHFKSYMDSRRELLNLICKKCGFSSIEKSFFSEDIERKDVTAIECGIYDFFIEDIRISMNYHSSNDIVNNLKELYNMRYEKKVEESTNKTAWKYNNLLRG